MKRRTISWAAAGAVVLPALCAVLASTPARSSPEIPNLVGFYIGGYVNDVLGESGTLEANVTRQVRRKFDGTLQADANEIEPGPVLTFNRGTISARGIVNLVARATGEPQYKIHGRLDGTEIEGTWRANRGAGRGTFFLVLD